MSLDTGTVDLLKARRNRLLAEKLKAGEFWKGTEDDHVFAAEWGEPTHLDTVSSLLATLTKSTIQRRASSLSRAPGSTTFDTSTRRLCSRQAFPFMSTRPNLGTLIQRSRGGSTHTSSPSGRSSHDLRTRIEGAVSAIVSKQPPSVLERGLWASSQRGDLTS
nr:hypothetical protein [Actinomadura sp. K4S16]